MYSGIYRYRIATNAEVKDFIDNYDEVEDGYFNCPFMIYLGDYSHKSYKNMKDKYNLLVCKDDYRYLRLVRISDDYVTYEFPMKKRWFDKIHTEIIFDDIEGFKKYCYKYMDFKCFGASDTFYSVCEDYTEGDFIEITF